MTLDIIGFGALNFDKLYKVKRIAREGEHIPIESVTESPGGSAANTIYGLAKLGLKTGFIGAVGNDAEGEIILEDFKKFKVNPEGIVKVKNEKTGIIIGFVDKRGERTLYPYPGANNSLKKKQLNLNYVKSAKFLHLTSFVDEKQFNLQKWLIEKISRKVKISFGPGDLYVKRGLSKLSTILKKSEVVFFNAEEIEMLTGLDNYVKAAEFLVKEIGTKIVVVTLGRKGCYIKTQDRAIYEPAIKTKVLDTTGAGDAFSAGFLYGLVKNKPLQKCGKLGNFLASRCIEKFGARAGLLTKKIEKLKFHQNFNSSVLGFS